MKNDENSVIVIGEKKYFPHFYASEQELEDLVAKHAGSVFGLESFSTFVKKKMTSLKGISGIPDGIVVDFTRGKFYLIEVELSSHDIIRHISNQLIRFKVAMNNPETRRVLTSVLENELKRSEALKITKLPHIGKLINQPFGIAIIIDSISEQLLEIVAVLSQDGTEVLTIPFETYQNNSGGQIYKFATFTKEKLDTEAKKWTFKWSTVPLDEHMNKVNDSLKNVFFLLRQRIGSLHGVTEKSRKNWVTYQTSPLKNFCTVKVGKDALEVHLKCGANFQDAKGICTDQKRTSAWTFDKLFKISSERDIDYAMNLIEQSYTCLCK